MLDELFELDGHGVALAGPARGVYPCEFTIYQPPWGIENMIQQERGGVPWPTYRMATNCVRLTAVLIGAVACLDAASSSNPMTDENRTSKRPRSQASAPGWHAGLPDDVWPTWPPSSAVHWQCPKISLRRALERRGTPEWLPSAPSGHSAAYAQPGSFLKKCPFGGRMPLFCRQPLATRPAHVPRAHGSAAVLLRVP
jgi:hypothetical protein